MCSYWLVLLLVCVVNVRPASSREARALAFISGGPASQQIVSQKLGPSGALHLKTVQNLDYVDCPCGCNITTYRGIGKNTYYPGDDRCGTGIHGNMCMGIKVICPCGCEIVFPGGTNITFNVEEIKCNSSNTGSIDGVTIACSLCGCTGTIPTNGIAYRFGRSPVCLALGGYPGQTVIVSNNPGYQQGFGGYGGGYAGAYGGPYGYGGGYPINYGGYGTGVVYGNNGNYGTGWGGYGNGLGFGPASFNGNPYNGLGGSFPVAAGLGYNSVGSGAVLG